MNPPPDNAMERRSFQTSCERCRRRKIKCDRLQPCSKCEKAKADCQFIGSGEKQRPSPRGYVQALKGRIISLEQFITKLASVQPAQRDEMLATFTKTTNKTHIHQSDVTAASSSKNPENGTKSTTTSVPIRSRAGHLRRLKDGKAAEFYGATSFFQINPSDEQGPANEVNGHGSENGNREVKHDDYEEREEQTLGVGSHAHNVFAPQSMLCRNLMATFFNSQYQYHMCLYREYFLRDYDKGSGPYYSDLLMYAICALGALASEQTAPRELSDIFFNQAQQILYGSALESPNLPTLQALILLGHREIGHGKTSKGWLFSGMAFRLAHEMGLHLDPNNWNGSDDSRVEREILRRTYWAAFVADKQLSLYLGRPPALYPGHSDVHATLRIPYPPEWEALLNTYIQAGTLETAYEDGMTLVAAFVQQAELSKLLHRMITEVFENRNVDAEETVLATSIIDIHVALTKWSADLPAKLHWNQWSVGPIPSLVLHLHLLYHTSMILLHRPPRTHFSPSSSTSHMPLSASLQEDIQICYASLSSILKLLRIYQKHHSFSHLPFTFVHILASAASVVLMKRYVEGLGWDDASVAKPLGLILECLRAVEVTWRCAGQVLSVIASAMRGEKGKSRSSTQNEVQGSSSGAMYSHDADGDVKDGSITANGEAEEGVKESPQSFDLMLDQNFEVGNVGLNGSPQDGEMEPFEMGEVNWDIAGGFGENAYQWGGGIEGMEGGYGRDGFGREAFGRGPYQ